MIDVLDVLVVIASIAITVLAVSTSAIVDVASLITRKSRRELLADMRRLPVLQWTAAQWRFIAWLLFLALLVSLSFNVAILVVFAHAG